MLDTAAFGYLLSPDTLQQNLHKLPKDELADLLKSYLMLFQTEQAKSHAAAAAAAIVSGSASVASDQSSNGDLDVLIINESDGGQDDVKDVGGANKAGGDILPKQTKKQVVLQKLVLQLGCALRWHFKEINAAITLPLQHTLMEILLGVVKLSPQVLEGGLRAENVEQFLKKDSLDNCALFALTLFYRWALRSIAQLPTPVPVGNKAQIYQALSKNSFPSHTVGTDQNLGLTISTYVPVALKAMKTILESNQKLLLDEEPTALAFKMPKDSGGLIFDPADGWEKASKEQSIVNINYDLACHHICFEDYSDCAKCMTNIKGIGSEVLARCDLEVDTLYGLGKAIWGEEAKAAKEPSVLTAPAFTSPTKNDGEQILKVLKKDAFQKGTGDVPFYWRANYELNAWNYGFDTAAEMNKLNLSARIDQGRAPNFETFNAAGLTQPLARGKQNRKAAMFNALKTLAVPAAYKAKPSISCKMYESKQKVKKLRAKASVNALFREMRPEKILKMSYELSKSPTNIRRLSTKWNLDDPFAANYMANFGRAGSAENDFAYVLLAKIGQLNRMGGYKEAKLLYQALEEADKERTQQTIPSPLMRNLQYQCLGQELNSYLTRRAVVPDSLAQKCRHAVMEVRNVYTDLHTDILESCLIALINKSDWEFVMSLQGGQNLPLQVQVSQLLLSITICTKGGTSKNFDVKKSCKILAEHIIPSIQLRQQGMAGSKRSRDIVGKQPQERPWLQSYLSKLHHPDVMAVLASIVVYMYNYSVDDSSFKINHEFPSLPMSAFPNTLLKSDAFLSTMKHMVSRSSQLDPFWTKFLGEMNFSVGNYASALKCFVQTLALGTHFFLKPLPFSLEQEDKMTAKVVKCLTELGYNSYAVQFCQCLSDVDYSTAFKCLEERGCNDVMDGIYDCLWDVTMLEYAVSMHTKRGELSRKKLTLEKVGSLEVNTNNNVEILRETSTCKRAKFLRVMCRHFL
jgi:hypothetical protein